MSSVVQYADLSDDQLQRIHALCQQFEQALTDGAGLEIETLVGQAVPDVSLAGRPMPDIDTVVRHRLTYESHLFRELLAIELESRANSGELPAAAEYESRFPERRADIRRVFAETRGEGLDDEIPARIGRYRVDSLLGSGGFADVFLGYDEQLRRPVAIKVPHRNVMARSENARAYLQEAQTLARLDHPQIAPVHDVGQTDEFPCYIVSKYIEGIDLSRRLKQNRLGFREAAELVADMADALHHAHAQGLVHRDVKPGNILLDENGNAHLTDFGLALRDFADRSPPKDAGTPSYMSPEQARGEGHHVDGRSDIYSLGVVLYELLTGRRPFSGVHPSELPELISGHEPKPPRQIDDSIPWELERICLKATARHARDRYTTALDMAEELRQFLNHPTKTVPPPGSRSAAAAARTMVIGLAGLIAVGLAAIRMTPSQSGSTRDRTDATVSSVAASTSDEERPAESPDVLTSSNTPPADRYDWPPDAPRPAIAPFGADQATQHQQAWAGHLGIPVEQEVSLPGGDKITMVLIPPGEFLMGAAEQELTRAINLAKAGGDEWSANRMLAEGPQHQVRITRPFALSRHEVTRGQFGRFVREEGYRTDAERDGKGGMVFTDEHKWVSNPVNVWNNPGFPQADDHPVVHVSWSDAMAFCRWLSARDGARYRLPTEAEWEYACRAGMTNGSQFGDGEIPLADCAWFSVNGFGGTHPVGQLKPNAWKLYDMHGNVWEWCSDWFTPDYYATSPINDPAGPATGWLHPCRGGSWFYPAVYCRTAHRFNGSLVHRDNTMGFRLASDVVRK